TGAAERDRRVVPRPDLYASASLGHSPVLRVVQAHREGSGAVRVDREGIGRGGDQLAGTGKERRRVHHLVELPVPVLPDQAQEGQAVLDQQVGLRLRGEVRRRVRQGDVLDRVV